MDMTGFELYPTIDSYELEEMLEVNLGESFYPIDPMIDPEYTDSYAELYFKDNGELYQKEISGYESEEDLECIRKMNLVREFLFERLGDKYDRILVRVGL